jgi:hypothetical protein
VTHPSSSKFGYKLTATKSIIGLSAVLAVIELCGLNWNLIFSSIKTKMRTGQSNVIISGQIQKVITAMSFFKKLFGRSTRPSLKTISNLVPGGIKAVESRSFQECKQVSAYVVFDATTDAVIFYVDMALGWIDGLKPTHHHFQPIFDEEGLSRDTQIDTPQMVAIGTTLYMNRYTSMRVLLMTSANNATHITIPCPPDAFEEFARERAVLLISLDDMKHCLLGAIDAPKREYLLKKYIKPIFQ